MPIEKVISKESDDEIEEIEEIDEFEEESDSEYGGSEAEEDNLATIIEHFFTNDTGENLADILTGFKKSLDTQNKILMKISNILQEKNKSA